MNLSKKDIFHALLGFLPGELGSNIRKMEEAVTEKGVDKKTKVINATSAGLKVGISLSEDVIKNPKFQAAMGKVNDGLVEAANIAQAIHDKANEPSGLVASIDE